YVKDNKKSFEKLYPNHPKAEELVTTLTEQIKLDFNMNLLTYLTQGEMKQCLAIFNKKRKDQDESELTMEEMKEMYENKDNRIELFNNPGITFSDTYGVVHFARFLKAGYNYYGNEVTGFEKFYVTFFYDLLCFAENFSSEYA
uniref:Uncharacterized protein n=1 Tax=Panagrolaimus sp. ES5 TaxID=591445 RepID=A0AC34GT12_9BILA